MSCTPTPTATQYKTITTYTPSTSFSQSGPNSQPEATVVQSCVASGTISGNAECVSSTPVTQANTLGGGQPAQVPIVVTVPVTELQPTNTLYAPCNTGGGNSPPPTTTPTPSNSQLTTSVMVQSIPAPSTVVEATSTTLADGSVVQTIVTIISTLPATAVYEPTSIPNPSLQSDTSGGSGTDVTPIVGGVLGGFLGLIVIVGSLWWLCRRRATWHDIFEKEELQGDDHWTPAIPVLGRDRRRLSVGAEPKPYEYGLVGHVVPPTVSGSSRLGSVAGMSDRHSRHTSFSATPLLQPHHTGSSRPSSSGSVRTVQTHPAQRGMSPVGSMEMGPRSLSMISDSTSSSAPLLDGRMTPALLNAWNPNTDDLAVLEPLIRSGSPVSSSERRVLQIVNDVPPSPTDTVVPSIRFNPNPPGVILHTDGGRAPDNLQGGVSPTAPPPYSR